MEMTESKQPWRALRFLVDGGLLEAPSETRFLYQIHTCWGTREQFSEEDIEFLRERGYLDRHLQVTFAGQQAWQAYRKEGSAKTNIFEFLGSMR